MVILFFLKIFRMGVCLSYKIKVVFEGFLLLFGEDRLCVIYFFCIEGVGVLKLN